VRTLRAAADLLSAADSIEALVAIATVVGCGAGATALDDAARLSLGLGAQVYEASVSSGIGATRALTLLAGPDCALRDLLPRLAARLSARTPHVLWLVLAAQPSSGSLAICAWTDDRRPPRVSALLVDRFRLVDSDAETLRALAADSATSDILAHSRWVEVLGRQALTVRFYRAIEQTVGHMAHSAEIGSLEIRREIALLNASRLLFLSFLEAKGWLDGDNAFLAHRFDQCMASGGHFHTRVLRPLFFGTLNTPIRRRAPTAHRFGAIPFLNGGLFSRTPLERRHRNIVLSDESYGALISNVFGQYRFTAREESATWSEAAVDPEMLGRAFESLMAPPERTRTGAFFTPFPLVERVANAGIDAALHTDSLAELFDLTVLDPACGSGAFLVHVLERIAQHAAERGDGRSVSAIRRQVLTRSIFGVDVNPTAVWLCELRLWLSVVIESDETNPAAVVPLPNLDRNIRTGDALSGRAFGDADSRLRGGATMRRLRQRYSSASGPRKVSLGRELDRAERCRALAAVDDEGMLVAERRRDLLIARRGRDLFGERYSPSRDERASATELRKRAASLRVQRKRIAGGGALPFSFVVHFADVATRGGFGLVIGNPPWVRLHNIPVLQRAEFRRTYEVARNAAWEPGASPSGAGAGFAAQVDIAALFVERSVQLLHPGAALALLLPVKLWQSLAGGGVRTFIADNLHLRAVDDYSGAPALFDAAVYPSLVVGRRRAPDDPKHGVCTQVAVHRGRLPLTWQAQPCTLPFDASPGAPWVLLPPDARRAFNRLRDLGVPFAQSALGRPHLGVKCGCNDAFVVELLHEDNALSAIVAADGKRATVESHMLRPLLRGEHLRRWRAPATAERIIWTHGAQDSALPTLPPHTARWMKSWRTRLEDRTDARHGARWWSLFRTESARGDQPRVVWGDMGREPRACVLPAGDVSVPLNSCYVARCADLRDAFALSALLNGLLARAWLDSIAEPARGGYHRYLGWTISLLPVPKKWHRARALLAPLGEAAHNGNAPTESALIDAAVESYGVSADEVAPLLAWHAL
jgi:hypothetical protein